MVHGHDTGEYSCSISTIQKLLKQRALTAPYVPAKRRRNGIRKERQEYLKVASKARLEYYYESKAVKKESGEGLEVLHNSFTVC